ncbi:MAG: BamA/TamA family outer membrane protein [Bacteroidales bacterium]|nr:BamA/TamA family outer membrane protein [Bacteroidales bacterium]
MQQIKTKKYRYFLLVLIFSFTIKVSLAQGLFSGSAGERSEKNFSFKPIPFINYDRSIGFMAGFVPIAMYNLSKKDTISPSSISGAFGMYSTSKTWFAMVFSKFYFHEDRYRAVFAAGTGNVNFQFFIDHPGYEGYVKYNTVLDFVKLEFQRRVFKGFYAGVNYSYAKLITEFGDSTGIEQEVYLNGWGLIFSYDRRDNVYYPRKGLFTNLKYTSFPEAFGNEFVSQKIELDYNHYFSIRKKHDVIAARFYGGFGIGEVSFNQQFVVGNTDIRGYSEGKYRGDQVLAIQGEYRWNPWKKIGFIAYLGFATVFNSINEDDNGKILPAAGTGFRYLVFPKNHMNVGMDVAVGEGDWGLYFRIGESF